MITLLNGERFKEAFRDILIEEASYNRLIFYINKIIKIKRLYIFNVVIKNILKIIYIIKEYLEFTRYYKRIVTL